MVRSIRDKVYAYDLGYESPSAYEFVKDRTISDAFPQIAFLVGTVAQDIAL